MVEEIKLLLPLLEGITESGTNLILVYLLKDVLLSLIWGGVLLTTSIYLLKKAFSFNLALDVLKDIRDMNKLGYPGPLTTNEMRHIRNLLKEKGVL